MIVEQECVIKVQLARNMTCYFTHQSHFQLISRRKLPTFVDTFMGKYCYTMTLAMTHVGVEIFSGTVIQILH